MQENINYSNPDDGFGDKLRNAFIKVQNNFTELFNGKVDKITGKGLSENDFTDADKLKLDGIEDGAQVNVNADFGENDPSAPGYILNRPPSMYASVGYFTYNDVSTISSPLVLVSGVAKKLTNDTLGSYTGLGEAPYGVANIWKQYTNQFDFSQLAIGDTLDMRVDALLTTTGTNKTYKILLKLGIGTPSEFTILVGSGELKNAVTDENIVKEISFYIGSEDVRDAPAELYLLLDGSGSVKVNGWYTRIIRKGLNLIDINSDPLKLDKVTTADVEKVYIKNADGTQSMKPTSELGGSSVLGASYVKKSFANMFEFNGSGAGAIIPLHPSGYSEICLINAGLTSVSGVDLSLMTGPNFELPYQGKYFLFWNRTGSDITLNHEDFATADLPLFIRQETNIIFPQNHAIVFRYDSGGLYEIDKTWNIIDDVTGLQAELDLKADLVGGKVPASQLPSYEVDDITGLQTALDDKQNLLSSFDESIFIENNGNIEANVSLFEEYFEQQECELNFTPIQIIGVYLNGIKQKSSLYTITLPKKIRVTNYILGDYIEIQYTKLKI